MDATVPDRTDSQSATENQQINKLIDSIIYLASLASRREDVEPMMDTLRNVTSLWNGKDPLKPSEYKSLQELESKLKLYLVTKDPLRAFTLESLQQRLHQRQTGVERPHINGFVGAIGMSVAAGVLALVAPFSVDIQARLLLAVPSFFLVLHLCAAWFYISALRNFKSEFRRAYIYFTLAVIVLSLAFSHYVIINLLHLDTRYPIFRYGGITLLVSAPFALIYWGLRIYARLLQIKTRFTSLWLILAMAAAMASLIAVVPRREVAEPLYSYIWTVSAAMILVFGLPSSILANKIRHVVTESYARSMKWIHYYTLVIGLTSTIAVAALVWLGELYGPSLAAIIAVCGIAPELVLLYASYSFKKETNR